MKSRTCRALATLLLIAALAGATACEATPATPQLAAERTAIPTQEPTPTSPKPKILTSVYDEYSVQSGKTLEDPANNRKLYMDGYTGTAHSVTNIYISNPDGTDPRIVTDRCVQWSSLYLVGDMLYFHGFDKADKELKDCRPYRVNVALGGEPEAVDMFIICTMEDYFYYAKEEYGAVLYRCDADLTNEIVFPGVDLILAVIWVSDGKLFVDQGSCTDYEKELWVLDKDGTRLHTFTAGLAYLPNGVAHDNIYYWYHFGMGPSDDLTVGLIRRYDMTTDTHLPDLTVNLEYESSHGSIFKIEDGMIYISIYVGSRVESDDNIFLYKLPITGGNPEFVASWS